MKFLHLSNVKTCPGRGNKKNVWPGAGVPAGVATVRGHKSNVEKFALQTSGSLSQDREVAGTSRQAAAQG